MKDKFLESLKKVLLSRLKLFSLFPVSGNPLTAEDCISFSFRVYESLMQFILGYCLCFKLFIACEADLSELIAWAAHLEADLVKERYEEIKNGK